MQSMMRMAGAFSKQARDPMVSTVSVSGHRMARINAHTGQIIDVDKETVTELNFDRKTFTVMTFAQMKHAMDDMAKRMQQSKNENAPDVKFKASAKDTGQTKTIDGLTAREMLLTVTMEGTDKQSGNTGNMDISSDMWIAPVAGYDEVRNFYKLYAAKMGMLPGQNLGLFAARPEMIKAMGDFYKEMSKLDGAPVQMVMRVGGTATGTPPSQDSTASSQQPPPPPSAKDSAAGAALGRLGLGGFGRRKKPDDQQQQQQQTSEPQTASGLLMEVTTESSGFSANAVDPSKFEIPAGFKQVESEMGRHPR